MILIADSGSTKTDWIIIDKANSYPFQTKGINPFFLDASLVKKDILNNFPSQLDIHSIKSVFFYGPGCSSTERCAIVEQPLNNIFKSATIKINTDLLGAARALFQKEKGIACILGTGSNSGLYNGNIITENIPSTGYILGDEGSGAKLGLELIKLFINKQLDTNTENLFIETYNLTLEQIIDKVYRQSYPNRFLASFTPFILKNIKNTTINKIVKKSFSDFINLHILPYSNAKTTNIAFVGSVAYYFKNTIEEIALEKNIRITKYEQKPILELAKYHALVL